MKSLNNKKLGFFLLLLVLIGTLSGCTQSKSTQTKGDAKEAKQVTEKQDDTEKETKEKTVVIGQAQSGDILNGILGVAQQEGFIEEELKTIGYKPQYIGFAGAGPEVNEAFATKKLDFSLAGNLPPLVAKSNGIDVSILNVVDSNLNMAFVTQPNQDGINGLEDIEGKTVLVGKGTILQYLFAVVVDEYGLDINKIKIVNTVADASAAFLNGDVDVYITTDIQAQLYVSSGDGKIIFNTSDKPEWSSQQVLAGRNEFLKENPEVAVAIEKALIRAYDFANANPEKAYQDFTLNNKYTVDLIKKVYSENNEGNGQFEFAKGNIEEEDIKKLSGLSEFLYQHKIITNQVDITNFVNTKYYDQALKELK